MEPRRSSYHFSRYSNALQFVIQGIDKGITNDILAMEIRQALHHLGEIIPARPGL